MDISMEAAGITSTAISEPFPLFTEEAIRQARAEIFSRKMLEKHQVGLDMATMIRGYCPENPSFVYDAWDSPVVLGALSKVAGIDLVPAMDVDVGHVNISVQDDTSNGSARENDPDEKPAFDWHSDSCTFVCVTMLSDCAGMVGGETAIRTGTDEILKFRGPAMGTAIIVQGGYIERQALKAFGSRERTSKVTTTLRPKLPFVRDDETTIKPLLPITHKNTLYYQCPEYRLEDLEERVRPQLKVIRQQKKTHRDIDIAATRKFLLEERAYVDAMLEELAEVP